MPRPKKSLWDVAGARIGVVSGALGLVVAVVGLPHTFANALGRSESKTSALELKQARVAVAAAGPRLDVSYLFLRSDLFGPGWSLKGSRLKPSDATMVLDFLTVEDEILRDRTRDSGRRCALGNSVDSYAFLVIRNRGRRDADKIAVRVERLQLSRPIRVREGNAGGDDYVANLRNGATAISSIDVKLPMALGPGDGVRVPLFVSAAAEDRHDRWCVVSPKAYLPRSLTFVDPVVGSQTRRTVRRMVDPVVIANGAYDRG